MLLAIEIPELLARAIDECAHESGRSALEWLQEELVGVCLKQSEAEEHATRHAVLEDIYGEIHQRWENGATQSLETFPIPKSLKTN